MKDSAGWLGFSKSGFVCLLSSILVAVVLVVRTHCDAHDLKPFVLLTLPFAASVTLFSQAAKGRMSSSPSGYATAFFGGVFSAVVWTAVVTMWLGPFFDAFGFPVLLCWVAGGISGLTAGINGEQRNTVRVHGEMKCGPIGLSADLRNHFKTAICMNLCKPAFILGNCVVIIVCTHTYLIALERDQEQPSFVFLKWKPGSKPLATDAESAQIVNATDLARIASCVKTGSLEFVAGSAQQTDEKRSQIIVVMHKQLNAPSLHLPLPQSGNIIYVQKGVSWKTLPDKTPTMTRSLQLHIEHGGKATGYWIDLPTGGRMGGVAFEWKEPEW